MGAAQGDFQLALLREALDGDGNPLEGPEPSGEDLVQRMRLVDLDFVDLEEHVPLLDARLGGRAARRDAGDEAACRETAQRGLLRGEALTLNSEVWQDEPRAYRTVALHGFPNFFLLLGPHSPIGNQSLFTITETQVEYAVRWIERWRAGEFTAATPRGDATDRFNEHVDRFNNLASAIEGISIAGEGEATALAHQYAERDNLFPDIDYRLFAKRQPD